MSKAAPINQRAGLVDVTGYVVCVITGGCLLSRGEPQGFFDVYSELLVRSEYKANGKDICNSASQAAWVF